MTGAPTLRPFVGSGRASPTHPRSEDPVVLAFMDDHRSRFRLLYRVAMRNSREWRGREVAKALSAQKHADYRFLVRHRRYSAAEACAAVLGDRAASQLIRGV